MKITEVLNGPIPAILLAATGLYGGYVSGKTETTDEMRESKERVEALSKRIDTIEAMQQRRTGALYCAIRTLDRLTEKTGVVPPCPFQEIN